MRKTNKFLLSPLILGLILTPLWGAKTTQGKELAKGVASMADASQMQAPMAAKAKTMAELAARYDSTSCKDCHEEIYSEWQESLHSKSMLGTPRTAPTIITAVDKGLKEFPYSGVKSDQDIQVKHLMLCAKCHLPQLKNATDEVARELVSTIRAWMAEENDSKRAELEKKIAGVNIGCTVCHNDMAIIHKWADGFPQPDTVYGSKAGDHEHPSFTKIGKAPALGESIFCGQCHGQGPNFDMEHPSQCATLYGSYLFAYVPEGGTETCQECHMQKSKLGHNMQSYRSAEMRAMAVDVKVESRSIFWRKNKAEGVVPMGYVDVEMYNKAGHTIPDG
jgi:hypothetical protein